LVSLNQSINIRLMRGTSKRRPTHVWHTIEWTWHRIENLNT